MIRAAAKNFKDVGVVTRPEDYRLVIDELKSGGVLTDSTKRTLARKAFAHTAAYDASIFAWFDEASDEPLPPTLQLALVPGPDLRYGENPPPTGDGSPAIISTSWILEQCSVRHECLRT